MSNEQKKFFKKLEKEHYTVLVPDMCPIHFAVLSSYLSQKGMNLVVVTPEGREAKDLGLTAIHNDSCYPVIIIAGAFIKELRSGKYDLNKTAVIISQTGGGCRASNYLSLFKKAFDKEFPTVPVLSFNLSGLEKERSLPLTLNRALHMYLTVVYGDFLMNLTNQAYTYYPKEEVDKALNICLDRLKNEVGSFKYLRRKKHLKWMKQQFMHLQPPEKRKPRVGVVGEIYVKYSPYANNHLGDFLLSADCEPVFPSLNEFVLYTLYNYIIDFKYYGRNKAIYPGLKIAYKVCLKITRTSNKILRDTSFLPFDDFADVVEAGTKVINEGVKMGEGWLIPAEMVCFAEGNTKNIVVVQPFGCLPNHIVGKGMIRAVKQVCPEANIVPLDFDASSTSVNQENRLKLMLANIDK